MATNTSNSSTGRKRRHKPVNGAPEIPPQQQPQQQEDACQAPQDATDASEVTDPATSPTDSIAPADAATVGDDIRAAAEFEFDLDAYMAEAVEATEAIIAGKREKVSTGSGGGEPRQRAVWPAIAQEAASRAGLRLPGLYPKPGSKSARAGAGWYRDAGAGRPPGKNAGIALQTLWQRIGQPLAAGQALPTAALFATIAAIKTVHAKNASEYSEWLQYIIAPSEPRPDGSKVGAATCILHQVALMAGPVIMTTETIRKV